MQQFTRAFTRFGVVQQRQNHENKEEVDDVLGEEELDFDLHDLGVDWGVEQVNPDDV